MTFVTQDVRGVLFDLDGTLVESLPDIANAINMALQDQGLCAVSNDLVSTWVGNGSAKLIDRAITHLTGNSPSAELSNNVFQRFLVRYAENIYQDSVLYDGVITTLEQLRAAGFAMAVVTNKPHKHSVALLQAIGLSDYFSVVIGGDTLPVRKPDPAQLLLACEKLSLTTGQCVMVGDSQADILAAQAADMPVLCLTYGYNQGVNLASLKPTALLDRFSQVGDKLLCDAQ